METLEAAAARVARAVEQVAEWKGGVVAAATLAGVTAVAV